MWRGPARDENGEKIGNAPDDLFALDPVSQAAAVSTRSKWSANLSGQTIPLIWERVYAYEPEEE